MQRDGFLLRDLDTGESEGLQILSKNLEGHLVQLRVVDAPPKSLRNLETQN